MDSTVFRQDIETLITSYIVDFLFYTFIVNVINHYLKKNADAL